MEVGVTLSHLHARKLGLDCESILREVKSLGFTWIRLGVYWNEVEAIEGEFDFESVTELLDLCTELDLKVVMCVGMKAPRWPEFHFPVWIAGDINKWTFAHLSHDDELLLAAAKRLVKQSVHQLGDFPIIKVWQVENEPLDASGSRLWKISWEFLMSEVSTLRRKDLQRKVMLTAWGNELGQRGVYKKLAQLGDIVGVDWYPKCPNPLPVLKNVRPYVGLGDSDTQSLGIAQEIRGSGKRFWVSELQMEPWEEGEEVSNQKNPPSCMPEQLIKNWTWVQQFEPEVVLFWGVEYWMWKREQGDSRWWNEIVKIMS